MKLPRRQLQCRRPAEHAPSSWLRKRLAFDVSTCLAGLFSSFVNSGGLPGTASWRLVGMSSGHFSECSCV
ncbi:hypothetical protein CHLRE_17g709876v5 [Chlamydomonas reinhardtii]|uniref:Uncharacterized protein n=1 Tax=Chlamydomonas reinhardtii TaxID=3055 RepID=A0A2K3CPJ1_CHLRE|nr:uncharacterized protein CHLRE_17g709876v5 [Chlamydomonas reinhardtii]PNW70195.1 hypothetical protein CHLRE_17g709876v5 [Chlamydomonas reinhardtii]